MKLERRTNNEIKKIAQKVVELRIKNIEKAMDRLRARMNQVDNKISAYVKKRRYVK